MLYDNMSYPMRCAVTLMWYVIFGALGVGALLFLMWIDGPSYEAPNKCVINAGRFICGELQN